MHVVDSTRQIAGYLQDDKLALDFEIALEGLMTRLEIRSFTIIGVGNG